MTWLEGIIGYVALIAVPISIIYLPFAIRNFVKKRKALYRRSIVIPLTGLILGFAVNNMVNQDVEERELLEIEREALKQEKTKKYTELITQFDQHNDMNAECHLRDIPEIDPEYVNIADIPTFEEFSKDPQNRFCPNDMFSESKSVLLCRPHQISEEQKRINGLDDRFKDWIKGGSLLGLEEYEKSRIKEIENRVLYPKKLDTMFIVIPDLENNNSPDKTIVVYDFTNNPFETSRNRYVSPRNEALYQAGQHRSRSQNPSTIS